MSKVKQVKIAKQDLGNYKELGELLDQMTGMHEEADPDIVIPKIVEIKNCVLRYLKVLNSFVKSDLLGSTVYDSEEIRNFVADSSAELEIDVLVRSYTSADIFPDLITYYQAQMEGRTEVVDSYRKKLFAQYKKIKESKAVQHIVATCGSLKQHNASLISCHQEEFSKLDISEHSRYHSKHYSPKKVMKPDWNFINELQRMQPLSFSKVIDFKYIWIHRNICKTKRRYVLKFLFYIYMYGSIIFDITTSPDIDTRKLSELFIEAIKAAKAKMPGFDKAFKIIESATDLLDRKFNEYYRESVRNNKNSGVFFENFVLDLAVENTDAVSRMQLKQLAAKLRDMISQTPGCQNNQSIQTLVSLMGSAIDSA